MNDIGKIELLIHQAEQYVAMKSARENLCWENIIDQIVEEYLGVNHKNAHSLIMEYMPHLSYKTILSLWEGIHAPLTYSSLEFHIYALSYIMKSTNWNGSFNSLSIDPSKSGINNLYLSGHIDEYYTYYAKGTPLHVLFSAKKYFHVNDVSLVHASLTAIQGLMGDLLINKDTLWFIDEMIKCRDCTSEISVKVQVDEILYDCTFKKI